jgi:FKBP-type peptidyl-prolyl cis-trans isomerase
MNRASRFVILLSSVVGSVVASVGCRSTEPETANTEKTASAAPAATAAPAASDGLDAPLPPLQKEQLAPGNGPEAKKGDRVLVHYTGTLVDGTKFDSSLDRNEPFDFTLGKGEVIPGWDLGVVGLQKGSKWKLTIPPHLGYGTMGAPPKIPGNATLIFVIELVDILPPER